MSESEWSCRDCGATGSLADSVTHRHLAPRPPCGDHCPGDCGWNPDDPEDPCALHPDPSESA